MRHYLLPLTPVEERWRRRAEQGREALESTSQRSVLSASLSRTDRRRPSHSDRSIPNGAAARSGLLNVGDLISSINGRKVYDHAAAAPVITSSDGVLRIIVLREVRRRWWCTARGYRARQYTRERQAATAVGVRSAVGPPTIVDIVDTGAAGTSAVHSAAARAAAAVLSGSAGTLGSSAGSIAAPLAPPTRNALAAFLSAPARGPPPTCRCTSRRARRCVWRRRWRRAHGAPLRTRSCSARCRRLRCGEPRQPARKRSQAMERHASGAGASAQRRYLCLVRSTARRRLSRRARRRHSDGCTRASRCGSLPAGLRRRAGTASNAGSSSSLGDLGKVDLTPTLRPDGSPPMCFCHPPNMRVCRECTALKDRIEDATHSVASTLEKEEPTEPLQREASMRSLRTGAAWATRSVSGTGYEDARILHERLQNSAVQAILLERAAATPPPKKQPTTDETEGGAADASGAPTGHDAPIQIKTYTFTTDGPLGLTCRPVNGRPMVAHVSGPAFDLNIPVGCLLLSIEGRPLDMPYMEALATLSSMPRPFTLEVQLPETGGGPTFEEKEAAVLSDALVLRAAGDLDRKLAKHCADLSGRISPLQIGLSADVASRCSSRAFDAAAELLAELPTLKGPQAKLRCLLRAWTACSACSGCAPTRRPPTTSCLEWRAPCCVRRRPCSSRRSTRCSTSPLGKTTRTCGSSTSSLPSASSRSSRSLPTRPRRSPPATLSRSMHPWTASARRPACGPTTLIASRSRRASVSESAAAAAAAAAAALVRPPMLSIVARAPRASCSLASHAPRAAPAPVAAFCQVACTRPPPGSNLNRSSRRRPRRRRTRRASPAPSPQRYRPWRWRRWARWRRRHRRRPPSPRPRHRRPCRETRAPGRPNRRRARGPSTRPPSASCSRWALDRGRPRRRSSSAAAPRRRWRSCSMGRSQPRRTRSHRNHRLATTSQCLTWPPPPPPPPPRTSRGRTLAAAGRASAAAAACRSARVARAQGGAAKGDGERHEQRYAKRE